MTIKTIAFDGDDTLWQHDNFFRTAVEHFHVIMNSVGDFPDAREQLDQKHIQDLPTWGYGVKGLILSMIELAISLTNGKISGDTIQEIFDMGRLTHLHPVILLDHAAETVKALKGQYQIILITKGDLTAQEMKVHKSGLLDFFDGVEITSEKDIPTYKKIMKRYNTDPAEFIMIGNTLRSDILPPVRLGAQGIHVPNSEMTWHFENAEVHDNERDHFITLPSLKDVPEILEKLKASGQDRLAVLCQPASV